MHTAEFMSRDMALAVVYAQYYTGNGAVPYRFLFAPCRYHHVSLLVPHHRGEIAVIDIERENYVAVTVCIVLTIAYSFNFQAGRNAAEHNVSSIMQLHCVSKKTTMM